MALIQGTKTPKLRQQGDSSIPKNIFNQIKQKMQSNLTEKYVTDPKLSKYLEEFQYEKSSMTYLSHFNLTQIEDLTSMVNSELQKIAQVSKSLEKFLTTLRYYKNHVQSAGFDKSPPTPKLHHPSTRQHFTHQKPDTNS
jgi:DNA-directed RNA polymerase alpha subunit